jgi:hypothetical protein
VLLEAAGCMLGPMGGVRRPARSRGRAASWVGEARGGLLTMPTFPRQMPRAIAGMAGAPTSKPNERFKDESAEAFAPAESCSQAHLAEQVATARGATGQINAIVLARISA